MDRYMLFADVHGSTYNYKQLYLLCNNELIEIFDTGDLVMDYISFMVTITELIEEDPEAILMFSSSIDHIIMDQPEYIWGDNGLIDYNDDYASTR